MLQCGRRLVCEIAKNAFKITGSSLALSLGVYGFFQGVDRLVDQCSEQKAVPPERKKEPSLK